MNIKNILDINLTSLEGQDFICTEEQKKLILDFIN